METVMTKFPCPKCGKYYEPYLVSNGISKCECPEHGLFETSNSVSKNFRIFCSKIARKPNRSPVYYTSFELKVKKILDEMGYVEGLDYWHNVRIQNTNRTDRKVYYWLDFYIPRKNLVISCNPRIWHRMWNREKSDNEQLRFLTSKGLTVLVVDEKTYKDIINILKRNINGKPGQISK